MVMERLYHIKCQMIFKNPKKKKHVETVACILIVGHFAVSFKQLVLKIITYVVSGDKGFLKDNENFNNINIVI